MYFADVAELADAQASGACGLNARGGSTPLIRNSFVINLQGDINRPKKNFTALRTQFRHIFYIMLLW